MEKQNDFMLLRETVNEAVSQYMELRKRIDWKDKGKSATILRLAKPFQTGYFTIAVAGKMSSGKSTFINSLIGENLLPTGHFQTTSCITWIVSSEKRYMEVEFADGKKKTFTNELAKELKALVAVPQEFDSLPINHINILIKGGNNISTILKKKAGIEAITHTSSSDALWNKYVASMSKSKIADKVVIYLPLPNEYKGWRIVDTPGVGAIGGIQDATKKLLTSKEGDNNANAVDAVVLLHNGIENIEDESANSFAEDVSKSMGNLANGRLFFVLTHAGHSNFLNNKQGILDRAKMLFGKRLSIPSERVTYVDGLIHRFLIDAKRSRKDFSNVKTLQTPLDGWNSKDWEAIKALLSPYYMNLVLSGKEVNNNTLFTELESVSRFEMLRDMLYEFLNQEKEKTFSDLLSMIKEELQTYGLSLSKDIMAVSSGQAEIDKQIKEAEIERTNLNLALVKVQQKATPGAIENSFKFIDTELQKLSQLPSIGEVRTKYLQIINEGLRAEKEFFKTLVTEFSHFVGEFETESVTFKSLDFNNLEREAKNKATSQVTDYSRSEEKLVSKGGWSEDDEYETVYPYTKEKVDFDKKRKEFTSLVIKEGRKHSNTFKEGLKVRVKEFFTATSTSIKEKTDSTIKRLNDYKSKLSNNNEVLAELRSKLNAVEMALNELKKLED